MVTCHMCRRPIPPDETQLVRDRFTATIEPLVGLTRMSVEQIVDILMSEGAEVCASCFNKMNEEQPLSEFIKQLAEHPTAVLPDLFRFQLVKKGEHHGMG